MKRRFSLLACLLIGVGLFSCSLTNVPVNPPSPPGPTGPFKFALKGAWYRAGRASFMAELMDTDSQAQADAIADMVQNFQAMRSAGMNVAIVRMEDADDWVSQFGGGVPYDPKNSSAPVAQAEKTILDTADKVGIHIVFEIAASGYHRILPNDVDGNPKGAFDYFDQFTPDPRVVGWLLFDECDPSNSVVQAFLTKYWDHIYEKFHGPNTWVGINTVFNPDYIGVIRPLIDAEKHFFGHTKHKPDLYGMEWFCCQIVNGQAVPGYLHQMVDWMKNDVYSVPSYKIAFMSGGSMNDQTLYYPAAIEQMAKDQVAGLFAWGADGYTNKSDCVSVDVNGGWNLFTTSFSPDPNCKRYPPVDGRWHWNNVGTWTLSTESFVTQFGIFQFTGLTSAGQALAAEFKAH